MVHYMWFWVCSLVVVCPALSAPTKDALYLSTPDERHPIQPAVLFESGRSSNGKSTAPSTFRESRIIYVKLLKNYYHPKWDNNAKWKANDSNSRKPNSYEVFYVKALANGQFSTARIKLLRVPEFVAINVYKKLAESSDLI